jgi:hypothetical protein
MNRRTFAFKLLPALVLAPACGGMHAPRIHKMFGVSMATRWLDILLEASAREVDRNGPRPTVLSRAMAIPVTAMFDAWAAYNATAVGTQLGPAFRRPPAERTFANQHDAIGQAMLRTLTFVYPADAAFLIEAAKRLSFTLNNDIRDPSSPHGVGNLVADAIIAVRDNDGSNHRNDYVDTTGYQPRNSATNIVDPDRWQPIEFTLASGQKIQPGFLTPQWSRVVPFALQRSDDFRPAPPPKVGSRQLLDEITHVVELNARLTCKEKALVEFMRDGPRSTGQSGHWLRFAQDVSRRDHFDLDRDVCLYFAVANAAHDAFIAAWDAKIFYDSSRPWTLAHHLFADQQIRAWGGPDRGTVMMAGKNWHPYSPTSFITPPFPGYVSGHSCVSAACAETLRLFTGSDHFGIDAHRACGELTGEHLNETVEIKLPTFSATAEMAGRSRVLGGYHIESDNSAGLALGRKVATMVWTKVNGLITASVGNVNV